MPKISGFGLAKNFPDKTHISARVAGTVGYLAPQYAGQLTRKADVYNFGVLLLEIVCGRSNTNRQLRSDEQYVLERVWELYEEELEKWVDESINGEYDAEEVCRYLKIGLLCTQDINSGQLCQR